MSLFHNGLNLKKKTILQPINSFVTQNNTKFSVRAIFKQFIKGGYQVTPDTLFKYCISQNFTFFYETCFWYCDS